MGSTSEMSTRVPIEVGEEQQETTTIPECAVCLQCCIHPAQLPCSHVFCFLCVKGVANQSKKCPLCRQEIPADYLEKPQLLEVEEIRKNNEEYQWFYEGRNGWWQYDQRTSLELEVAYKQGKRSCELLIAGFLYVADFESMIQLRRNDPSRRRRIKRDLHNIPKKGVAGLRLQRDDEECSMREIRGAERSNSQSDSSGGDDTINNSVPINIPQIQADRTSTDDSISVTDRLLRQSESIQHVLEQMRSLVLGTPVSFNDNSELNETVDNTSPSRHNSLPRL